MPSAPDGLSLTAVIGMVSVSLPFSAPSLALTVNVTLAGGLSLSAVNEKTLVALALSRSVTWASVPLTVTLAVPLSATDAPLVPAETVRMPVETSSVTV